MEDIPNKTLPRDLEVEIFVRLPRKSLCRFKCIAKHWLAEIIKLHNRVHPNSSNYVLLISSPSIYIYNFSDSPSIERITFPPNVVSSGYDFVGSCNGLLCFQNSEHFVLYNPSTNDYRIIVDQREASHFYSSTVWIEFHQREIRHFYYPRLRIGFGYDYKSDDYKILSLSCSRIQFMCSLSRNLFKVINVLRNEGYIYSLRNDSWETFKAPSSVYDYYYDGASRSYMVFSNNALHWKDKRHFYNRSRISAFNLVTREFYEVPLPKGIPCRTRWNFAELRGHLHLVELKCFMRKALNRSYSVNEDVRGLVIWIMKEYNEKQSWTKLLHYSTDEFKDLFYSNVRRFDRQRKLKPFVYAYSRDEQEILVGLEGHHMNFFSCNLKTREVREVEVLCNWQDIRNRELHVAPLSTSFTSPQPN